MKSFRGSLSQRLGEQARDTALYALDVAQDPQLYLDRGWEASRRYFFSVIFIAIVLSKCFHILVHLKSLTVVSFLVWGLTFFLVDFLLILIACALARSFRYPLWRYLAAFSTAIWSLYTASMISANISYYVHVGNEIHWRNVNNFHHDKPTAWTVLTALGLGILIDVMIYTAAYYATPHLFRITDAFLDIWVSLLPAKYRCTRRKEQKLPDPEIYEQIAIDDYDENHESAGLLETPEDQPQTSALPSSDRKSTSMLKRGIVIACSVVYLLLRFARPTDATYAFLSATLPLAPFKGLIYRPNQGCVTDLPGDFSWLEDKTALDDFPNFDWLRTDDSLNGFVEWSPFKINHTEHFQTHYNPAKDPLHNINLQNEILEPLREVLKNGTVKIKHVILIKLESNRQDVFPFRSDSYIMKHIKESYEDGQIPQKVLDRLATLTPMAQRFTGFDNKFETEAERPEPYGGISAKNAYTSGTYTMKSLTGTICGLNPIAVFNNLEYYHDMYQPCLPHIFNALSAQPNRTTETEDWMSWPWHTMWMQSHYGTWDKQYMLTPAMGFTEVMDKERLEEFNDKYLPEEKHDHDYPDKTLNGYLRDVITAAKEKKRRLFLTHLTHNTHTPYYVPGEYEEFFGNGAGWNDKINKYLNTIVYQDEWLADIMEILNENDMADETLLVMAGDHGLSLPNDGGVTANHDPHVGSFHVPLFFSHPKLPQIEVDSAVLSTQILPTILDLLIESSSIDEHDTKIVKDLLSMYEGQSMIRDLIPEQDGKREWHFSTMNPGGTWVSMRAAEQPYRLVVPLIADAPWRFTDVIADPFELRPEEDLNIVDLHDIVQTRYGPVAAKWLSEAAHVSQWWIAENHKRWGYNATLEA
ncbi:Alkaline phosphatase-like alpha/beta/alpha [Penicillium brevicompactum]|uniref:Alkaline phosphatase-like alpha/beta/alpha n=1 Tax=Penicillium brevicompactum TaxID=5074 RepID=A0A9W9UEC7_PENBR|nr:Alkaline phosphatase-like alpha/beta/alpha [Penicillium brevicompactum]